MQEQRYLGSIGWCQNEYHEWWWLAYTISKGKSSSCIVFVYLLMKWVHWAIAYCWSLLQDSLLFSENVNEKRKIRLFTRVRACQVYYTTAIQAAGDQVFCVVLDSGVIDHCHDGLSLLFSADKDAAWLARKRHVSNHRVMCEKEKAVSKLIKGEKCHCYQGDLSFVQPMRWYVYTCQMGTTLGTSNAYRLYRSLGSQVIHILIPLSHPFSFNSLSSFSLSSFSFIPFHLCVSNATPWDEDIVPLTLIIITWTW